ncbi:hypothetical protein [Kribbella sp. NPDC051770]|uniref:hypothetical protein n=1 Tax=Kribbella sp. NPDC051770 TaxID=3155413 RepID=UPI00342AE2E5
MVFPVGHYTGLRASDDGLLHTIRAGWQQHRVEEDAFATWVLAHGLRETGKEKWTDADVLGQAEQAGIPGAAGHLQQLAELGLVASADDVEQFARRHRLGVLFVGLGNSPERLDEYAVGLPGLGTAARLDTSCYELWQWGSIAPTLWDICQVVTAEPGDVLGDLRFLLANGCAYLDVAAVS